VNTVVRRFVQLVYFWITCCIAPLLAQVPGTMASPVSLADASCAICHKEIFQRYLTTPMANASGLAVDKLETGVYNHAPSGVTYTLLRKGNESVLRYQDMHDSQSGKEWKLSYFLGSGHLGITWIYASDGYLFESPVAYYAGSKSLDMKPGLEGATQTLPSLPMEAACLRCHMSGVQASDPGTLNHYNGLPFLHTGITCESCHGDTGRHVETGGKADVINPARLDAIRRDAVCISCHLEGDISVEKASHAALDYKPGAEIYDYLSYFVYQGKDANRRGVSEVEQLSLSRCKRISGDKMSCTSCHDPHYTPPMQERAVFYRRKCLACHNDATFVSTHHSEQPDCTGCHMPAGGAENIPHVAWTDHRIRRIPDSAETIKNLGEGDELVSIFSPKATSRDLVLAYYHATLEGNIALQEKAYSMLNEIMVTLVADKDALNALGILSEQHQNYKQAGEIFEQVLKLDPTNLTALSNLGTLHAKIGDFPGAIAYLRPAFERNQDVVGLAKNLAQTQCIAGDPAAARATLEKTLRLNPGLRSVQQMMAALPSCNQGK
jgi:tetratricopeptide (TPR) repeat protein